PTVQIAPELPRFDHAPQVAVGGCDDPHVDSPEGGGAERLHLVVLDGTQELGLERRGEVLDLVEEERAAVCELEHARPFLQGAGESPAGVAEELGFGERFRHGRAVHRAEGAGSAPTQRVDGARDELLARPRLALDEYLRLGRGRHADERTHLVHGAAPADEAAERLAGRGGRARRTAATDRSRAEEAGDRVRNLVRVSIEHHVVGRPGLHGGDRVRGPVLGAHHEERNGGPPCPRRPHDVEGPGAVATRSAPASTVVPATASTAVTRPGTSATRVVSIFIASSTMTGCPASTVSPSATMTATTLPGMGATTFPERPPRSPEAVTAS